MTKNKDIRAILREHHSALSQNHKKVSSFMLNNFERIPFLNVHEIATECTASTATVVRFAQKIGYSGFSELRNAFARTLQHNLYTDQPFIKNIEINAFTSVADQDIADINKTRQLMDRKIYDQVIDLIIKSRKVYVAGIGASFLTAQVLSYQLNQVGQNTQSLIHGSLTFNEQILFIENDSLLIAFSFPPYSEETIGAVKFARERGIKTVAITNKRAAPITFFSDYNLLAISENVLYTNSLSGITFLINAIVTECALRDKQHAEAIVKAMDQLNNRSMDNSK